MATPIKLEVEITAPHEGMQWTCRVEVTNIPGNRIGFAEASTVAEAFNDSVLVALATRYEPEENNIS